MEFNLRAYDSELRLLLGTGTLAARGDFYPKPAPPYRDGGRAAKRASAFPANWADDPYVWVSMPNTRPMCRPGSWKRASAIALIQLVLYAGREVCEIFFGEHWSATVDGNRKLNRARQPNIDQLRREPGSISSREEAGVGSGGLG